MIIENLKTNQTENPVGTNAAPYFSWIIKSDEKNVMQTAYKLIVKQENTIVWDTGKVESDQSAFIEYAGEKLSSGKIYNFCVTVWDNCGNEAQGYSTFETALLEISDWKAKWIESVFSSSVREAGFGKQPPATMFRKKIELKSDVLSARAYVTCHGIYCLTVNGIRPDNRELAPEHTVYKDYLCYQTYDITAFLMNGENAIGVYVGDGWYCGSKTKPDMTQYKPVHALLMQIHVKYTDGSEKCFYSDGDMKCSTGAVLSSDLFAGEKYDSNSEQKGWDCPGFNDDSWKQTELFDYGYDNLVSQTGEPVRSAIKLPVKNVFISPKNETIIDFGQIIAGRIIAKINEPKGAEIVFDHFEVLDKDGNYFDNIMAAGGVGEGCEQRDVYISNGSQAVYEPLFTYHGFRYVRVKGIKNINPEDFTAVVLSTYMKNTGTFECSDSKLNRLYENVRWSQRANMISIPTDCPQREKAGWTGDIAMYATTSLMNEDTTELLARWLENLTCDQRKNGAVPFVVPKFGPYIDISKTMGVDADSATSAGWGDAAVLVPYSMYQATGNTIVLKKQYNSMKKWCNYIIETAKNSPGGNKNISPEYDRYLWNTGFHYGEWLIPSQSVNGIGQEAFMAMRTSAQYTAPIFGYNSVKSMSEIAEILGFSDDAEYYSSIAEKMKDAILNAVIDENGNMPAEYMGAYVLPLYFDLVPEKHRDHFKNKLVSMIEENGNCLDTGFLATPFLLDTLCKIGREDKAYELLFQTAAPSWLYAVEKGATTIWESWYAYDKEDNPLPISFNHYTFGCVADWIFRNIAGISKSFAGFKSIIIRPVIHERITYAKRAYSSVYGDIICEWEKNNDKFSITLAIPCNTTATIIMPNGKIIETGSGRYTFNEII